jgi:hypothetical protein
MSLTIHDLRVSLRDKMKLIDELQHVLGELKTELSIKNHALKDKDNMLKKKEEIVEMQKEVIKEKDHYILELESELRQLQKNYNMISSHNNKENGSSSMSMDYTTDAGGFRRLKTSTQSQNALLLSNNNNPNGILTNSTNFPSSSNQQKKSKRFAISAEPAQVRFTKNSDTKSQAAKIYDKSKQTREFLKNAIYDNDFMKNLEIDHIESILECMHPVQFCKDSIIIKEGEVGNVVYIIEGKF